MSAENDNQPATQADVAAAVNQVNARMAQMEADLRGEMAEMEDRLKDFMRGLQTEILRVVEGFAQPFEIRLR